MKRFLTFIITGVLLLQMPLLTVYAAVRMPFLIGMPGVLNWFDVVGTVPKVVGGVVDAAQDALSSLEDEDDDDEDYVDPWKKYEDDWYADLPGYKGSSKSTGDDMPEGWEDPWKQYEDDWYADLPGYKVGSKSTDDMPEGWEDPWKQYDADWDADRDGYRVTSRDGGDSSEDLESDDSENRWLDDSADSGPGVGHAASSGGSGESAESSDGASDGSSRGASSGGFEREKAGSSKVKTGKTGKSGSGLLEGASDVISAAQVFLRNLTKKLEDPELTAPDDSPFDYVDGINMGGDELSALRGTAARYYKLMLVLGSGGMVFSLIFGFFRLGLQGERVRHEVIESLLAKSAAVVVLTGFVAVFGVFGTIADQLVMAINSIP